MIKYLGSKRLLIPDILNAVCSIRDRGTVLDIFSGTSRVGHSLKRAGYRILSNDHNAYAHTLATCYIQSDAEDWLDQARSLIADLNQVPASRGVPAPVGAPLTSKPGHGRPASPHSPDFFTQTYCLDSRFFHPRNGPRIHAIREEIARRRLPPELHAIALTSLLEAADRVDSTTGVQMAYLKQWAPRAHKDLELRLPNILPQARSGKGHAFCLDAAQAARDLAGEADLIYLDPPYNQHSYLGNYHIWETLVRWDTPEVYGTARKRLDCRERKSAFNSKRAIREAFDEVLDACGTGRKRPTLVVSFSDEGYLSREELESMLSPLGRLSVLERDYKRYVGAQIGIYNPRGQRVGKVSHMRNTEMLFIVTPRLSAPVGTATARERKPTNAPATSRRALQAAIS